MPPWRVVILSLGRKLTHDFRQLIAPIDSITLGKTLFFAIVLHSLDFLPFYFQRFAYCLFLVVVYPFSQRIRLNWIFPIFMPEIPWCSFLFSSSLTVIKVALRSKDGLAEKVSLRAFLIASNFLVGARIYLYPAIFDAIKTKWWGFAIMWLGFFVTEYLQGSEIYTTPNAMIPEGHFGVAAALGLQFLRLLLPGSCQWLCYAFMAMPPPRDLPWVIGWILANGTIIVSGIRPDVAYCFLLLRTLWTRPYIGQQRGIVVLTDILRARRNGSLWLAGSLCVLEIIGKPTAAIVALIPPLGPVIYSAIVAVVGGLILIKFASLSLPMQTTLQTTPFTYHPLASSTHFRVLRIKPQLWARSNPVQCTFIVYDSSAIPLPPYQTISHRWKNNDEKTTLFIDGKPCQVPVKISQILKSKRSFWRKKDLWIDSLCINQKEEGEKSAQIMIMKDIFAKSTKVVGWLDCSDYGFEVTRFLYRFHNSGSVQGFEGDVTTADFSFAQSEESRQAIGKLLEDEWFQRIWIVQEAAVAKNLFLKMGRWEIPWYVVIRSISALQRSLVAEQFRFQSSDGHQSVRSVLAVLNAQVMESAREWHMAGNYLGISDMVKLCLIFNSSQEKDKVYGILGLVNQRLFVPPGYSHLPETASTYLAVALRMIHEDATFEMMRYAGIGQPRHVHGVPSWVPDWSAGLAACILSHPDAKHNYRAGRPDEQLAARSESTTLVIAGIPVGTVKHVIELPQLDFKPPILCDEIIKAVQSPRYHTILAAFAQTKTLLSCYPPTDQPIEEAFWRTLLGDMDPLGRPASDEALHSLQEHAADEQHVHAAKKLKTLKECGDIQAARFCIKTATSRSDDVKFSHLVACDMADVEQRARQSFCSVLNADSLFRKSLVDVTVNRQLAITNNGYLGLVPRFTAVGDAVVIPVGARTPFVFRMGLRGFEGSAQLVGECYVHGVMDGEMMPRTGPVDNARLRHVMIQ